MQSSDATSCVTADQLSRVLERGWVAGVSGARQEIFPVGLTSDRAHALCRLVAAERPVRTIETGFGLGISALAIVAGADSAGVQGHTHTAIDPFQRRAGLDSAGLVLFMELGLADRLRLIERRSEYALPAEAERLDADATGVAGGATDGRYDLAFVDGDHRFEHALMDIWLLTRLVRPGGLIIADDAWMPSVRTAANYAASNLGLIEEPCPACAVPRLAVLRVPECAPERPWDHFVPFAVQATRLRGAKAV